MLENDASETPETSLENQDRPTITRQDTSKNSDEADSLDASIFRRDRELQDHLRSLKLETLDEYVQWCKENGFGTSLKKNWKQRCKEKYFASRAVIEDRRIRLKKEKRRPQSVISAALSKKVAPLSLNAGETFKGLAPASPWAKRIEAIAADADDATRFAFKKILHRLHQTHSPMLMTERGHRLNGGGVTLLPGVVYPHLEGNGNSYIQALASISLFHQRWVRPVETWKPKKKNVAKQFSSLCRHLLAEFPTPEFLDCVWFANEPLAMQKGHEWFIDVANGTSVRKLGLPIPLSKKMAHHFMRTPNGLSIMGALRRAQILASGGSESLLRGILSSRLATTTDANDFWLSVIKWIVKHPMLNPTTFGPLTDYFQYEKFDRAAEGQELTGYCINRRSPTSVLRRMHQWHAGLRHVKDLTNSEWPAHSDINPFEHEDTVGSSKWAICQLLSVAELQEEGRQLRHCVLSYAKHCLTNATTIWSMTVLRKRSSRPRKVLTIEVSLKSRTVRQVRGRGNRNAKPKELALIKRWASEQGLKVRC